VLSPFRWIPAISSAINFLSRLSFVHNDFSQLNTTSFFTQSGKVTAEKFDEVFKKVRALFID